MEKISEVVFGDSLCHEIKISKFSKNNTIIKFDPLFSICDLSNIDKHTLFLLSFVFEAANGLVGRHIVIVRNMTFGKIR